MKHCTVVTGRAAASVVTTGSGRKQGRGTYNVNVEETAGKIKNDNMPDEDFYKFQFVELNLKNIRAQRR